MFLNLFTTFYASVLQAYKAFFIAGMLSLGLAALKLTFGAGIVFYAPQIEYAYVLLVVLSIFGIFIGNRLLSFKQKKCFKYTDRI